MPSKLNVNIVPFTLPIDLKNYIDNYAKEINMSRSELFRQIIIFYIELNKKVMENMEKRLKWKTHPLI